MMKGLILIHMKKNLETEQSVLSFTEKCRAAAYSICNLRYEIQQQKNKNTAKHHNKNPI